jgi:hypothetical protein
VLDLDPATSRDLAVRASGLTKRFGELMRGIHSRDVETAHALGSVT